MATRLLHHEDSFLLSFSANVVAHTSFGGQPAIVLDETAFYPESGGQMADHGRLGAVAIRDVQIDDAGVVHHIYEGTAPQVGASVFGAVDRARRRLHMALHTGQHMLSRALADVVAGETVSSRLGENACTIDIDRERVDERDVSRAEDLVNAIIDDDVPVRAWFPGGVELAALPLRRAPKVETHVRVVAIGDFDVSPCGGTHCIRTAQVGLVRINGLERYKGKVRITFSAGGRARRELSSHDDVLRGLSRELTCGPGEVPTALAKLRRDLQDAREALGQSRTRLAAAVAQELIARALGSQTSLVTELLVGADADFARAVAKRVVSEPSLGIVVGASSDDGIHVVIARGAGASLDCGAAMKRLATSGGGRGGGTIDRAEGKLPAGTDWAAVTGALLSP